jgi:rhamnose utilization protein RhaD (predicted bifunctional aldolase and dehydrogenase)
VPYTDPGYMLARRISRLVENYQARYGKTPGILFLEKHGLFITTDSAGGALRLVRRVIKQCNNKLKQPKTGKLKPVSQELIDDVKACIERGYSEGTGEKATIWHYCNNAIDGFCRQKDAKKMLSGSLTPDELVYSNGPAMWVTTESKSESIAKRLSRQIDNGRKPSVSFLVKGVGLFVAGTEKIAPTVRDIVLYSIFIRTNAVRMGGIRTLNKRQEDFISNWESEAFRKKLATGKK